MTKKRMGEIQSNDDIDELIDNKVTNKKPVMVKIDKILANAPTDLSGVQPGPGLVAQLAAANVRYNELVTKFNTLLDRLEQAGLMK